MSTFHYRRKLTRKDWTTLAGAAGGAAAGIAVVILYFGRIWLQRVPLETTENIEQLSPAGKPVALPPGESVARLPG